MVETGQQILRHVLESQYPAQGQEIEIDSTTKGEIFEKLKDSYDACIDLDHIRKVGPSPLLDVLRKIEELFPASRPSDVASFPRMEAKQVGLAFDGESQLSKTIAYLNSIGVTALVQFGVGVCLTSSVYRNY